MSLNEFDQEYEKRGVPMIRYVDDIVLLCKSQRAVERLLESSTRVAKVNARKVFKFLGFAYSKGKDGMFTRVHPKSLQIAKYKLRELMRRNRGRNVRAVMSEMKHYRTGWLNYCVIAFMKQRMHKWDAWLRRRIRMYIWK